MPNNIAAFNNDSSHDGNYWLRLETEQNRGDDPTLRPQIDPYSFKGARVCENYVSRERMAEIMDVSVKTIDRLVARGMPSETWGLRTRRFLPSVALAWARSQMMVSA